MKIELSHEQLTTIRMALIGWSVRCRTEAKRMDAWAKDETLDPAKCRANAAASRRFEAAAEALLKDLP